MGDDSLHEGWSVDEPEGSHAEGESGDEGGWILDARSENDLADSFTGEAEILGVARGDDRVRIDRLDVGHLDAWKDDMAVGFVGEQVDRSSVTGAGRGE